MLYGNYCYIFKENFPEKFSVCIILFLNILAFQRRLDV